jgi:hypothetical protein
MLSALILTTVMAASDGQQDYAYQHLKELECFIGDWEGKGVVPASPANSDTVQKLAGKPIVLKLNVSWGPGKCSQIMRSTWEVPGEILIQSMWIRGWDQRSEAIRVYSFTTHKGAWDSTVKKEGEQWLVDFAGVNLDGSRCKGKITIEFKDEDTFVETEHSSTVDGKPIPDLVYTFTRVKSEPPTPNSERLKDLAFIIGTWEAKNTEGGTTQWSFEWSANKNSIENELIAKRSDGEITNSAEALLAWDTVNRRFTNWWVDGMGNANSFVWAQTGDKTWNVWRVGATGTSVVTIVDDDTWVLDWGTGKSQFKRVPGK